MSFWQGFEKRAVSMDWAVRRMIGGIATRSGLRRNSLEYLRSVAKVMDALYKDINTHGIYHSGDRATKKLTGFTLPRQAKIFHETKHSPKKARELLQHALKGRE